ncbi:UNVERIFIED_CONTAM: hypothetical protein FKN15_034875 [Acipenser sinensis]
MRAPRYRSTGEAATQSAYPNHVVNTQTWSARNLYRGGQRLKPWWVMFYSDKNITISNEKKVKEREYTECTRTDSPQQSGSAGGSTRQQGYGST